MLTKKSVMNNRLQQFLNAENITQSQLAERLGVAKASVSHILAGRNKPGYDFIESLSSQFPNLNLEWLVCGRGRMYKITGEESPVLPQSNDQGEIPDPQSPNIFEFEAETSENQSNQPKIVKVVVFYDNGTFQEIV